MAEPLQWEGNDDKRTIEYDDQLMMKEDIKKKNKIWRRLRNDSTSSTGKPYLGRRRNSSFADFLEGDFSQNLLSRVHFGRKESTSDKTSSSDKTPLVGEQSNLQPRMEDNSPEKPVKNTVNIN